MKRIRVVWMTEARNEVRIVFQIPHNFPYENFECFSRCIFLTS